MNVIEVVTVCAQILGAGRPVLYFERNPKTTLHPHLGAFTRFKSPSRSTDVLAPQQAHTGVTRTSASVLWLSHCELNVQQLATCDW